MKIAITGHANIEKALNLPLKDKNGNVYNKEAFDKIYNEVEKYVKDICKNKNISFNDLTFISGMARGVDEIFAIMAIRNNLKLILAIPNSIKWHKNRSLSRGIKAQAIYYDKILNYKNIDKIYVTTKDYKGEKYQYANFARNQLMVDIADFVISYKRYESSGANDCIKRAKIAKKYLGNAAEYNYNNELKKQVKNINHLFNFPN